jgi:hypothetical protein
MRRVRERLGRLFQRERQILVYAHILVQNFGQKKLSFPPKI